MQMLNDSSLVDLSYETMWRGKLKQNYKIDKKKKKKALYGKPKHIKIHIKCTNILNIN